MRSVYMLMHQRKPDVNGLATRVLQALKHAHIAVAAEPWIRERLDGEALASLSELTPEQCEAVLSVGGDGTLLRAGMPLVQALKLTEPLDPVKGRLSVVSEHIRQGYRFSQALEKEGSFPEEIVTIIRVGESGSNLPDAAVRLGASCWEYAQSSMQKWATLAEPLIILVMGVLVGFVVVAVLLPIFDLSSLAGR